MINKRAGAIIVTLLLIMLIISAMVVLTACEPNERWMPSAPILNNISVNELAAKFGKHFIYPVGNEPVSVSTWNPQHKVINDGKYDKWARYAKIEYDLIGCGVLTTVYIQKYCEGYYYFNREYIDAYYQLNDGTIIEARVNNADIDNNHRTIEFYYKGAYYCIDTPIYKAPNSQREALTQAANNIIYTFKKY